MHASNVKMRAFIIGDSLKSNSLGRVLSMAISAEAVFGEVVVLAYNDGPMWSGSSQFEIEVTPFSRSEIPTIARQIRLSGTSVRTVAWFSKGADPVGLIAKAVHGANGVTVVADFDDNDVAIMKSFRSQSFLNSIKMNRLRRKHPSRLSRAQLRLAARADALSFSNSALANAYRGRFGVVTKPWAIVPHTRRPRVPPRPRYSVGGKPLTLGFLGTVRAHKGAAELVNLMRQDRSVTLVSFSQEWSPPRDCERQWHTYPPATPLSELYDRIDFLVLPMDGQDEASVHQLPAKLVDAAANGCPVAATPTPPIREFAGEAIVPIDSWEDTHEVLSSLTLSDLPALSAAITRAFNRWFSPDATGRQIRDLVSDSSARGEDR